MDELAESPALASYPRRIRIQAARSAIESIRQGLLDGGADARDPEILAAGEAARLAALTLRSAINMSGVILHTGLGRARLAEEAAAALLQIASSHALVELDPDDGRRGNRQDHVRPLLTQLTGAEDAIVVNNAAAGVLLSLAALCRGREVVLSRGQMVEIGGSFRLHEIAAEGGCRIVEVGCTNKTRLSDYEHAITDQTSAILRCHPSNFKVVGFAESVSAKDLAELCKLRNLHLIDDVGSGCLVDTTKFGLSRQPTLQESVASGAVTIGSGDKLLGGPQCGIVLGSAGAIAKISSHPLARAMRLDKLTLAALEATLRLYAADRESEIPTIRYLARRPAEVLEMCEAVAEHLPGCVIEPSLSEVGGGSLPGEGLATWRIGLPGEAGPWLEALRGWDPPIIGRIEKGKTWLDPRTCEDAEIALVCEALTAIGK